MFAWLLLFAASIITQTARGESVSCPKSSDCQCTSTDACIMNCPSEDYCKGSSLELTCTSGQPCTIICSGPKSCQDSTVNINGATSLDMQCTNTDTCKSASVTCPDGGDCLFDCTGSGVACEDTVIDASNARSFICTGSACSLSNIPDNFSPSPTIAPSESPTTSSPSSTETPSKSPSDTSDPLTVPSQSPTPLPTTSPVASPTAAPTISPIVVSTASPTVKPTKIPTESPTKTPTENPTASEDEGQVVTDSDQDTDTNSNSDANNTKDSQSQQWPLTVLEMVLSVAVVVLCVFLLFCWCSRRQKKHKQQLEEPLLANDDNQQQLQLVQKQGDFERMTGNSAYTVPQRGESGFGEIRPNQGMFPHTHIGTSVTSHTNYTMTTMSSAQIDAHVIGAINTLTVDGGVDHEDEPNTLTVGGGVDHAHEQERERVSTSGFIGDHNPDDGSKDDEELEVFDSDDDLELVDTMQ